jgi:hypothetical protein
MNSTLGSTDAVGGCPPCRLHHSRAGPLWALLYSVITTLHDHDIEPDSCHRTKVVFVPSRVSSMNIVTSSSQPRAGAICLPLLYEVTQQPCHSMASALLASHVRIQAP